MYLSSAFLWSCLALSLATGPCHWPEEGFWLGGKFEFSLDIPKTYPHEAPKVHCNTKVSAVLAANLAAGLAVTQRPAGA